jgi:uncharacterized protein (DUF1778 family)
MSSDVETKRDRLHLRLDAGSKRILERAAAYTHTSVSDFVLTHALEAAETVVAGQVQHVLGDEDWAVFMSAIENPPEPNPALRAAVAAYAERRGEG